MTKRASAPSRNAAAASAIPTRPAGDASIVPRRAGPPSGLSSGWAGAVTMMPGRIGDSPGPIELARTAGRRRRSQHCGKELS